MAAKEKKVKTLTALAKAIGRPLQTVSRWAADARWPFGGPPWTPGRVKAWAAATFAEDNAAAMRRRLGQARAAAEDWSDALGGDALRAADPDGGLRKVLNAERAAKLKLIIQRAAMIELQKAILAGKYVDKEEYTRGELARIQAAKATLLVLPRSLAPLLKGLDDEAQIEGIIESHIREALAQLGRAGLDEGAAAGGGRGAPGAAAP